MLEIVFINNKFILIMLGYIFMFSYIMHGTVGVKKIGNVILYLVQNLGIDVVVNTWEFVLGVL